MEGKELNLFFQNVLNVGERVKCRLIQGKTIATNRDSSIMFIPSVAITPLKTWG